MKKLFSNKNYKENTLFRELLQKEFNIEKIESLYNKDLDLNILNENKESILHLCAEKGLNESSTWLINKNANINVQNNEGASPIFYALEGNYLSTFKLLDKYKANVNHLNIHKRTLLQEAVISGNNKFIDYLFERVKDLNNCDVYKQNLIFDAVANGDINIITKIANIKSINLNQKNKEGNTVLNKESVLKNKNLSLLLMDLGLDPSIKNNKGKNFLFYAVTKGIENLDILEKAVELGCDINSRSSDGSTVLHETINIFMNTKEEDKKDSLFKMIIELINKGIDINVLNKEKESAFFIAIKSGHQELIDIFLNDERIDINQQNMYKETVLFIPVNKGLKNLALILKLLKFGINPNLKNLRGQSAIEMLINIILHLQNKKKSYPRITDKLDINGEYITILGKILDSSAVDLSQLNSFGKPLFFDVLLHYNYGLFKMLKNRGININQKDKNGQNILFNFLNQDINNTIKDKKLYLMTLQNLINLGIDINEKDNKGDTVLHKAVANKCEYTVKLLLEAKPNFFLKDKKGRSIIHNCIWKDSTRYFKLIHSYNTEIINICDDYGVRPINYAAFMGKYKLVIDMLDAGALVNNPNKKDAEILEFFKKFHKNILKISEKEKDILNRKNLLLLAENMQQEFLIKNIS